MQDEERGLYTFAGLVLVAILGASALAYVVLGDGRPAVASSPTPGATAAAVKQETPRPAAAAVPAAEGAAAPVCTAAGAPRPLADEIHESSGVAVSRAHAGIFWTHNDSGDPLLYAVDEQGRTAGRVGVAGAAVEDWEDVARGPCPGGGDCLYVADIGDNQAARPYVTVYRVPEPAPGDARTAPATPLRLRYPDGAHDAEAMFVLDGAVHVVTKGESGPIAVYRAPADAPAGAAAAAMRRVRELSPGKVDRPQRITSADASADGRWVAMRTLDEVAIYPAAELAGTGALSPRRVDVKGLDEAQGEGLGFAPDGSIILTSEGGKKDRPATFARLTCTLR